MVHWNDPVHIKKLTTSRGTNSLKAPLEIANVSNSEAELSGQCYHKEQ